MMITFTTSARAYVAATQALSWDIASSTTNQSVSDLRDLAESVRDNCLNGDDRIRLEIDDQTLMRVRHRCKASADALYPKPHFKDEIEGCLAFVMDALQAIRDPAAGGFHTAA